MKSNRRAPSTGTPPADGDCSRGPKHGNGPGLVLRFLDDIPGPADMLLKPGQIDPKFDETTFQVTAPTLEP